VHWAGSDTSEIWNGYVEGALQAGLRAANEVNALL
jgi:monoamine oxidase